MVVLSIGIAMVVVVTLLACVGGGGGGRGEAIECVRPSVCSLACFPDRFITRLV